jgi:uncharacterized membrane protein YcaP (DUF421 family)
MDPVLRAAAVYLFLVVVFRIAGKRSLAQITTFDFVLLLIIGESTQQALLGDDFSVTNAFLVIVTLIVLSLALDLVKEYFPKADRFLEDLPVVIAEDSKPIEKRMRMVNVDREDILEAARQSHGLRGMGEIAYAVLERNGEISVIPVKRRNEEK